MTKPDCSTCTGKNCTQCFPGYQPIEREEKYNCKDCVNYPTSDACVNCMDSGKARHFEQRTCGNCGNHGEHRPIENPIAPCKRDKNRPFDNCSWKPIEQKEMCGTCGGAKQICKLCKKDKGNCKHNNPTSFELWNVTFGSPCPTCRPRKEFISNKPINDSKHHTIIANQDKAYLDNEEMPEKKAKKEEILKPKEATEDIGANPSQQNKPTDPGYSKPIDTTATPAPKDTQKPEKGQNGAVTGQITIEVYDINLFLGSIIRGERGATFDLIAVDEGRVLEIAKKYNCKPGDDIITGCRVIEFDHGDLVS